MKVAVVYNRESRRVINLFGTPNREKYGRASIERILQALRKGGHQVAAFEGDKDLIDNLESFMPRVVQGERPGMVFNLSYGIQGQARYTHVPGILEMVGIPYVGSGPLAHSLALDKVVAKIIFVQHGLATPPFAVVGEEEFDMPALEFPLIVKPRNEAVSMGLAIVNDEAELRAAAGAIFERFNQAVLVERYIEGREINVGLLGNNPPDVLPPAELLFDEKGPRIYTLEDKRRTSGREILVACPAQLDEEISTRAQELARRAFNALGCADCARVDMRLDGQGNLYILEINSLPSLGAHGSYAAAAAALGLDFPALVNRLIDVACARYYGTPSPPDLAPGRSSPAERVFAYVTQRRDELEKRLHDWTAISSRSGDPVGLRNAFNELERRFKAAGLQRVAELSDAPIVATWESPAGLEDGTLLITNLDVTLAADIAAPVFRRDPEWLFGEGIASSRAPLAMIEHALRALRHVRALRHARLGVLVYADEGHDCALSREGIERAAQRARQVLVLRPGSSGDKVVTQRRGLRRYQLNVRGPSRRLGERGQRIELLRWLWQRLDACCELSSRKDRIAVGVADLRVSAYRLMLPHEATVEVVLGYPDQRVADDAEGRLRSIFRGARNGYRWSLELVSDRPPMPQRRINQHFAQRAAKIAEQWGIPFGQESSLLPSVAGLVPDHTMVLCGLGPSAAHLHTAQESLQRISLVQRTLLLAQLLLAESGRKP